MLTPGLILVRPGHMPILWPLIKLNIQFYVMLLRVQFIIWIPKPFPKYIIYIQGLPLFTT